MCCPSPTFICHSSAGYKNRKSSPRILPITDGRITPGETQKKSVSKDPTFGTLSPLEGQRGLRGSWIFPILRFLDTCISLSLLVFLAVLRREIYEPQPFSACADPVVDGPGWLLASKGAWPELCQTRWEQESLGQLTAVALALMWLSAFPCCSESPGSRWEEACGSTSLTYMSALAPRLGRGRSPACLRLFQEHSPTALPSESCSGNRVWQVVQTPTDIQSHITHMQASHS